MFAIHAHLLPSCRSYAEAEAIFERSHQHARFGDWRGLKDRRDTSKLVSKNADGVIRFRYHRTNLVSWAPGEVQVITCDTRSSIDFSNRFLPAGIYAMSKAGVMHVVQDGMYYTAGAGPLVFRNVGGRWAVDPDNVNRFQKCVVDRSKMARVRKIMKPFIDWNLSIDRLTGASPTSRPNSLSAVGLAAAKDMLSVGAVCEDKYPLLRQHLNLQGGDFWPQMYVLGGAVSQELAPLGEVCRASPYDHLAAWSHL